MSEKHYLATLVDGNAEYHLEEYGSLEAVVGAVLSGEGYGNFKVLREVDLKVVKGE